MGFKDLYYRLEDKWFGLLDWLEAHHVNLYPMVDPLEKKGVPSLPVFTALFLVFIYLLFSFIMPAILGGGGEPVSVGGAVAATILDQDGNPLAGMNIEIFKTGELQAFDEGITDTNGGAMFFDVSGVVALKGEKSGCDPVSKTLDADDADARNVTLTTSCSQQILYDSAAVCFTTPADEDAGAITYHAYKDGALEDSNVCSDASGKCHLTPQDGYAYKFEGANGFESDQLDAAVVATLPGRGEAGCIALKEKPTAPQSVGKVTIIVNSTAGTLVPGVKVELVNPEDNQTLISSGAAKLTGTTGSYLGKAVFDKLPVGNLFRIMVSAGNNTSFFKDADTHNVTALGQTIFVTIDIATPTRISVRQTVGGVELPLAGVRVTAFNRLNENVGAKTTDASGDVIFGLNRDVQYRAALFLRGYAYKETTVTGGQDATVTLDAISVDEQANLDAYVLFKTTKQPVTDATLSVKRKDASSGKWVPSGYPSALVDEDGYGRFEGLLAEEVCVQTSRPKGKPIDCTPKTLETGDNELEINIDANLFALKAWVYRKTVNADESVTLDGVKGATVTLYDWETGEKLNSGTTFPDGHYTFTVGEDRTLRVDADFKDARGQYSMTDGPIVMTGPRSVTFTLELVSNAVSFVGITDETGELLAASSELGIDVAYYAEFLVGLKDVRNGAWDSVTFTLANADSYLDFYAQPGSMFEFSGAPGNKITAKLTGNYDEVRNKNLKLRIPLSVKPTFSGTRDTTIAYSTEWKKAETSLRDPTAGEKTSTVHVSSFSCQKKGNWAVCMYVQNNRVNKKPSTATVELGGKPWLVFQVTNLGAGEYAGKFTLMDEESNIKFHKNVEADVWATKRYPSATAGKYEETSLGKRSLDVSDKAVAVDMGQDMVNGEPAALARGDRVNFGALVDTISPTEATRVALKAGSELLGYFDFEVTGTSEIEIKLAPSQLYDFTPSLTATLTEKSTKKPITTLVSTGGVTGTGIGSQACVAFEQSTEGGGNTVFNSAKGEYAVSFDNTCRLQPSGTVNVAASAEGFKPTTSSALVGACVKTPSLIDTDRVRIIPGSSETCKLTLKLEDTDTLGPNAKDCGKSKPVSFLVKKELACATWVSSTLRVKGTPQITCTNPGTLGATCSSKLRVSVSGGVLTVTNEYGDDLNDQVVGTITLSFEASGVSSGGKPAIKSDYALQIPFYVSTTAGFQGGGGGGGGTGTPGGGGNPPQVNPGDNEFTDPPISEPPKDPDDPSSGFANADDQDWLSEESGRFATVEQALAYGYALSNGYNSDPAPAAPTPEIITKNILLKTTDGLTVRELRDVAFKMFSSPQSGVRHPIVDKVFDGRERPDLTVATELSEADFAARVGTRTGNWLVVDGSCTPRIGRNELTIKSGSSGSVRYSIASICPLSDQQGWEITFTTSLGVQLFTPAVSSQLKTLLGSSPAVPLAIQGKIETQALGTSTAITSAVKTATKTLFQSMYGMGANWDENDATYVRAGDISTSTVVKNNIILEVCDAEGPACDNYDEYTGSLTPKQSVIFLDLNEKVHFNAPTKEDLALLVNHWASFVGMGANRPPFTIHYPDQSDNSLTEKQMRGYWKEASSANVYVLAAQQSGSTWTDITNLAFLGNEVKDAAARLSGFDESKIHLVWLDKNNNQLKFNNRPPGYVILVAITDPQAASTTISNVLCSIPVHLKNSQYQVNLCDAFNQKWNPTDPTHPVMKVPEGGISWKGNVASDSYLFVFAPSKPEKADALLAAFPPERQV